MSSNKDKFELSPELQKLKEEYSRGRNSRYSDMVTKKSEKLSELEKSKIRKEAHRIYGALFRYILLIVVAIVILYPIIWMVGATFKNNNGVFNGMGVFTLHPTLEAYKVAFDKYGGNINILKALVNTYSYVIPEVILTVVSSLITAYGFSRFNFIGRKFFYAIMMSTLFLPQVILYIPQYLIFSKWNMVGSELYLPLILPTAFATESYFVYMFIQFLNSTPRDLEDNAKIDGCNYLQLFGVVIVPMMMPAIITCAIFKFTWASNDFLGPLLYVNSPTKYPASLFVRMSMDADSGYNWTKVLVIALISIVPNIIIFMLSQNRMVEEIASDGIKL